jgi:hypothetical protein
MARLRESTNERKGNNVLGLVIVFCVVFFALAVILWAGTLGFQGLIYNEPATGLPWRGPAAAAALTALFAVWCYLSFSNFDPRTEEKQLSFDTIFRFQPDKIITVDKLYAVKNGQETLYTKRSTGGTVGSAEFRDTQGNPWRRSDTTGITEAIIVEENGQRVRFVPKLARDGTFPPTAEAFPGYYEQGGRREMVQLGQVIQRRWGVLFLNIILNLAHLGLWFLCFWLLLRFQWTHALGLAAVAWVVATVVLLPMLFNRTRDVAKERANPAPRAARIEMPSAQPECRMCMMSPSLTM